MLGPSAAATLKVRSQQPSVRPCGKLCDLKQEVAPKSGDLVAQVEDQMGEQHQKLGKLSASLVSVRQEVDKTEQSMLGKVLDLQTARSFFVRHEEIGTSNEKLTDDVSMLNTQVEDLSSSLSKVQRRFLTNGHLIREAEGK